jgi:bifunctional DNA-binding transcriptional regulator/antitoxin component of YhaV-PrlF toxin-antitoxin module
MSQLTLTSKGQVTLRRNVLKHLGVAPGEKIDVELLPNGRAEIKSARPAGSIDGFIGLLAGKSKTVLTIEEMNKAAAAGWAKAHERRR